MRIGILANSLSAAANIWDAIASMPHHETVVLVAPVSEQSRDASRVRDAARLVIKSGRRNAIAALRRRAVVRLAKPFHHPESIARLQEERLDVGLHKSGNIYRRETIECFRLGILNAHIGLLPKYRGRSVMEWSLLQGDPVGISVFFIDEGIDTGERIVLTEHVDVSHCRSVAEAKQYLFDQDATFYRRALERLISGEPLAKNDGSGRRYFVMSKLFQAVAQENLTIGNRQSQI